MFYIFNVSINSGKWQYKAIFVHCEIIKYQKPCNFHYLTGWHLGGSKLRQIEDFSKG